MTTISTEAITGWESPGEFEGHAETLRTAAGDFQSAAEDAKDSWAGLAGAYQGEGQEILWSALDDVADDAGTVQSAAATAADALDTFVQELRTLRTRRSELLSDIGAFSREHGSEGELDDDAQQDGDALTERVSTLASDYQGAVQACVWRLQGIGSDAPQVGLFNGVSPMQDFLGALPGAFAGAASWGSTLTHHVAMTTVSQRIFAVDTAGTVTENFRPQASALTAASTQSSRFTMFGATPGQGFWRHQISETARQARNWSLTTGIHDSTRQMVRAMATNGARSMPLVGEALALRDRVASRTGSSSQSSTRTWNGGRVDTSERMSTASTNSGGSRAFNAAIRGTGTVGTMVSAGMTYSSQKNYYLERNAQENPGMSSTEVQRESTHDAAADTAGQVGTTVLASAAAGAAVGSIVPGAGTVVGGAIGIGVGVVTGVATNLNFLPDVNGDGTKDSLASVVGHGAKESWKAVRGFFS